MTRLSPATDEDLLVLVEASLFEVPLAADEILDVETTTGVNLNRMVTRVKLSLENARDKARRAAFAETDRRLAQEREEVTRKLSARPRLTAAEARSRILVLKERLGSTAAIEGYKWDKLSDDEDDLNALIAELEMLIEKTRK